MANIMIDRNFDLTTYPYWGDRARDHPRKSGLGLLINISYSHYLGEKSQVGIILQSSGLRTVKGYHYREGKYRTIYS